VAAGAVENVKTKGLKLTVEPHSASCWIGRPVVNHLAVPSYLEVHHDTVSVAIDDFTIHLVALCLAELSLRHTSRIATQAQSVLARCALLPPVF
jgi:hypothetical protein